MNSLSVNIHNVQVLLMTGERLEGSDPCIRAEGFLKTKANRHCCIVAKQSVDMR